MKEKYRVLIVDDEPLIQSMTRSALRRLTFLGQEVELLSAQSAEEARKVFEANPDISVILLDVVMEHEMAGLDFSKWLREPDRECDQPIILRTGQAGQFHRPSEIFKDYPINDYREKIELANPKSLQNVLISALITFTLQELCVKLTAEDKGSGWDSLVELGVNSGAFYLAEPLDSEFKIKWPLSAVAAGDLALVLNTSRRLRAPITDKVNETETKPAPVLITVKDSMIQVLVSYQPDNPRRGVVEGDSRRVDTPLIQSLNAHGWWLEPWWSLKIEGAAQGDYTLWCNLKKV